MKISAQDMQKYILRIDEEQLTDAILQQLIKNMPEPDQLSRLEQFKDQYNELAEAEQFAVTVSFNLIVYTLTFAVLLIFVYCDVIIK